MKICVSGWYYTPELLNVLKNHNTYIVGNRFGNCIGIPHSFIDNEDQYEWGNYSYFLMNIWDGISDVLFMHDDTYIVNERIFDIIPRICREVTFISTPDVHATNKDGKIIGSGRMLYIEKFILDFIKKKGGFPINNTGNIHMNDVLFMNMVNHRYNHFITEDFRFDKGEWHNE